MNNYQFDPEMYKIVAKNINKYCELKSISLSDLAKYTEISESFLEKFCGGKDISISIYDLYKISVVLDVNISLFFN